MALRKIIEIDEAKCNGCGLCVPNCAEGAIQIIDGKAKLIDDIYCDGLGACLGHCPEGALNVIERDADEFDEAAVIELLASQGRTFTPQADHQEPVKVAAQASNHGHGHHGHGGGCPGSRMLQFDKPSTSSKGEAVSSGDIEIKIKPQLRQWPVQLKLLPVNAPYFKNADLLVTADCVPFAYPNYHLDLLKDKAVVVGCPKLDDVQLYTDKLTQIIEQNDLKSITVAFMEVPCCQGIVMAVEKAVERANSNVKVNKVRISLQGEKI